MHPHAVGTFPSETQLHLHYIKHIPIRQSDVSTELLPKIIDCVLRQDGKESVRTLTKANSRDQNSVRKAEFC